MASITSLTGSSSSTSSLYGTRNVISGLASGLDTETLIQNCVQGYKTKISSLQKKQTQYTWKQDAYRSVTDKLVSLSKKYTSYTSSTNLFSQSFFNKAIKTTASGTNADKVSATGKATSNVQVTGIKQLATSAQTTISAADSFLLSGHVAATSGNNLKISASDAINLSGNVDVSQISGTMTLTWGSKEIELEFSDTDVYKDKDELLQGIKDKLAEATVTNSSGETVKANTVVDVSMDSSGKVTFSDKTSGGNTVNITGATGNLKTNLVTETGTTGTSSSAKTVDSFTVGASTTLYKNVSTAEYLKDKKISVTLDGVSKDITLGDMGSTAGDIATNLQKVLDDTFGTGKVIVNQEGSNGDKLSFEVAKGSSLAIGSSDKTVNKALGFGNNKLTTYVDTSATLGDLLTQNQLNGLGKTTVETTDKDGKKTITEYYNMTINGKTFGQFTKDTPLESVISAINGSDAGVTVSYSKLTNSFTFKSSETGSNSKIEIGGSADGVTNIDKDGNKTSSRGVDLATMLFGDNSSGSVDSIGAITKRGTDAVLSVSVDGGESMELTRSSNVVDLDGMSVTLKGTFGYKNMQTVKQQIKQIPDTNDDGVQKTDPDTGKLLWKDATDDDGNPIYEDVTDSNGNKVMEDVKDANGNVIQELDTSAEAISFSSASDTDTIIDTIEQFVKDYNEMVQTLRDTYTTQPAKNSSGSRYEPLTDDDKADMSESAIASYEEKAKQGLLFGDSDLSALYSKLTSAISPNGTDGVTLRSIGITTSYSDGTTTLSLDKDALKAALESNPDQVRDAFTKSKDNGASSDGLMASLKTVAERYANTSSANPGILVKKAGTTLSSLSLLNNTIQDQIDALDDQISTWQDRMSDKVDYYTSQFTKLEQLMSEMNSQSSTLSSLMGS